MTLDRVDHLCFDDGLSERDEEQTSVVIDPWTSQMSWPLRIVCGAAPFPSGAEPGSGYALCHEVKDEQNLEKSASEPRYRRLIGVLSAQTERTRSVEFDASRPA